MFEMTMIPRVPHDKVIELLIHDHRDQLQRLNDLIYRDNKQYAISTLEEVTGIVEQFTLEPEDFATEAYRIGNTVRSTRVFEESHCSFNEHRQLIAQRYWQFEYSQNPHLWQAKTYWDDLRLFYRLGVDMSDSTPALEKYNSLQGQPPQAPTSPASFSPDVEDQNMEQFPVRHAAEVDIRPAT